MDAARFAAPAILTNSDSSDSTQHVITLNGNGGTSYEPARKEIVGTVERKAGNWQKRNGLGIGKLSRGLVSIPRISVGNSWNGYASAASMSSTMTTEAWELLSLYVAP
jgi:hypothetical protein